MTRPISPRARWCCGSSDRSGPARAICNALIDEFIADGHCDAAQRYTRHIPVRVIAHVLGVPEEDGDLYIRWIHEILELGITDDEVMWKALEEMTDYFVDEIGKRRDTPRDDLIARVMAAGSTARRFRRSLAWACFGCC